MALTQVSTGGIKDDAVTDAKLPANSVGNSEMKDDAVGVDELSATGTASSSTFLRGDNSWVTPTDTNTQLTEEQVEDFVGGMVTGNTETGITVTYDDSDGTLDFVVDSQTDENFTSADHTKLDGIAASANNYVHPNHSGEVTSTADGATVIADDIVDEANLKISNAGSNGQYLQKQSGNTGGLTWADVPAGVGGATGVEFNDTIQAKFGTDNDLLIYHDGTYNHIDAVTNKALIINGGTSDCYLKGNNIYFMDEAANEYYLKSAQNGAVELYYDNSKKLETYSSGIKTYGGYLRIVGDEGGTSQLDLYADEGDDAYDIWQVKAGGSSDFYISGYNGSAYETALKATGNGAVELYHDGALKFATNNDGVTLDNDTTQMAVYLKANDDLKGYIYAGPGDEIGFKTASNEWAVQVDSDAEVALYYDGVKKLETSSAGGTLHGTWTGAGGGIQQYDEWVMTSNTSTSQNPIDSNWSRVSFSESGLAQNMPIGSGMSASSGVFTFPTTGFWKIYFAADVRHSDGNMWTEGFIQATPNDGSNWYTVSQSYANQFNDSNWVYGTTTTDVVLDITDTSNQKVRFTLTFDESSNGVIIGKSDRNATYATFMKIADT